MTQFLYFNRSFEWSETKVKEHMIIIFYDYTMLLSLLRWQFNSKHRAKKKKAKDTETRKTKTQKDENLVLPKE